VACEGKRYAAAGQAGPKSCAEEAAMLWNASAINGYDIAARDGRLGTVSDLLFGDVGWVVRWLVVDTGDWLSGRKVLLPVSVLGKPDPRLRRIPVELTMQQVKDSPDIDTERPVSRQTETDVYGYYGWSPYWGAGPVPVSNAIASPLVAPLWSSLQGDDHNGIPRDDDDPHLRSISAVTGYHIHATDGEMGHAKDFLVDDGAWGIRYVIVDTRNWWPGVSVLISPRSVREIDWPNKHIHLDVTRQKVKDGPKYDPAITLDGAYEETFLTYYGIRLVAM
jgi:hypothetical protein